MSRRAINSDRAQQLKLEAIWKQAWCENFLRLSKRVENTPLHQFTDTDRLYLKH